MGTKENSVIVYHGSTVAVPQPQVLAGRKNLDFGQGFYVTPILDQAERWAGRVARQLLVKPVVSIYFFDKSITEKEFNFLHFPAYDVNWLNFIVRCRAGWNPAEIYDCIEGGVANDRVIDTVEGFINGTIDADHALAELSKHQPNNQIAIVNQKVIEKCLTFIESKEL